MRYFNHCLVCSKDSPLQKKIDVFVEENGVIHPLEIKKSANPDRREIKKGVESADSIRSYN